MKLFIQNFKKEINNISSDGILTRPARLNGEPLSPLSSIYASVKSLNDKKSNLYYSTTEILNSDKHIKENCLNNITDFLSIKSSDRIILNKKTIQKYLVTFDPHFYNDIEEKKLIDLIKEKKIDYYSLNSKTKFLESKNFFEFRVFNYNYKRISCYNNSDFINPKQEKNNIIEEDTEEILSHYDFKNQEEKELVDYFIKDSIGADVDLSKLKFLSEKENKKLLTEIFFAQKTAIDLVEQQELNQKTGIKR